MGRERERIIDREIYKKIKGYVHQDGVQKGEYKWTSFFF